MKKYKLNTDGTSEETQERWKLKEIEYDEIVDRSRFIIDSESIRQKKISGDAIGTTQNLAYDKSEPSNLEIAIRSGKLDKADIHQEQLKLQKEVKQESKKRQKEAIEAARQEYLDKQTGFITAQADTKQKQ